MATLCFRVPFLPFPFIIAPDITKCYMPAQEKSDKKLYVSVFDRIDHFRVSQGLTWKDVSEKLGVSVAMLMLVKSGRRNLSKKAEFRLEKAEQEAGIQAPVLTPEGEREVLEAVLTKKLHPMIEKLPEKDRASATRKLKEAIREAISKARTKES